MVSLHVAKDCKSIISKNIIFYRKNLNLTQSQLAEKLKYSDKAISKWERGEAVPDIVVLNQLAEIFGIDLDTLCSEHSLGKSKPSHWKKHLIIALMSMGAVWAVATTVYVICSMIWGDFPYFWMAFIYALPCSAIVLIVFNALWGKHIFALILVSILIWTTALSLFLSTPLSNNFLLFILAIPLQVLALLAFFLLLYTKSKSKQRKKV